MKKSNTGIVSGIRLNLLYVEIQYTMILMMFLGNDLIEAIPLDKENVPIPGYLGTFKRALKEKYRETIMQSPQPPDFFVMAQVIAH